MAKGQSKSIRVTFKENEFRERPYRSKASETVLDNEQKLFQEINRIGIDANVPTEITIPLGSAILVGISLSDYYVRVSKIGRAHV